MGLIRTTVRALLTRIAERVGKNELFEKPGERAHQPKLEPDPKEPEPAPEKGSSAASTAAIRAAMAPSGRPKVVHHWATWCEPCEEELPELERLYQKISAHADWVGISWDRFQDGGPLDKSVEKVSSYATAIGITWPSLVATDEPDDFFDALELSYQSIPQTLVFDAEGGMLKHFQGPMREEDMAEVEKLLS